MIVRLSVNAASLQGATNSWRPGQD